MFRITHAQQDCAVRLGDGFYPKLSPDGKTVAAANSSRNELMILPIGPGEPRHLPLPGFLVSGVAWLPNGRGVLIRGSEGGQGWGVYSIDLDGGKPKAITKEGVRGLTVSPGGKFAAVEGC